MATELITQYLMSVEGIANVFTSSAIRNADYGEKGLRGGMLFVGLIPRRSGDIITFLNRTG